MKPSDLSTDVSWMVAYTQVETEVREFLTANPTAVYSTSDLALAVMPALESDPEAKARLFKALAAVSQHGLKGFCWRDGPKGMYRGKEYQARRWGFKRQERIPCTHCNGTGFQTKGE